MLYVFYDSGEVYINGNNKPLLNKNSFKRTTEAQFEQKLKNNEVRPKFTSSYKKKKKRVLAIISGRTSLRSSALSPASRLTGTPELPAPAICFTVTQRYYI